jgi:prepilin-type N-terminal cleavage/methylation domain-containing protein
MKSKRGQRGFSLLELLTAAAIFLVVCGAAFGLLEVCQRSYQTESGVLNSFQEARLGVDQIVRDVNIAGYPPPGEFSDTPGASSYASSPFAWAPNYVAGTSCTIGGGVGGCSTPAAFDLIIETNVDPQQDALNGVSDVEWVRYQLQGKTLCRGVAQKAAGADPDATTQPTLVPFVQNVVNNASGTPVPIFKYLCDDAGTVKDCGSASNNSPQNVRDVEITLIVQAPQAGATPGPPRLVTLNGRGHRINPNP